MTGILILIGSLSCFKEESQWTRYLFSVYFKIGFLNFSKVCCWYTLELPHRGNSNVHLQHPFNNECFHHKTGCSETFQLLFMFQCNEHVEMIKFLCSLASTWMTIIDSQFYIIDSLSLDVSSE